MHCLFKVITENYSNGSSIYSAIVNNSILIKCREIFISFNNSY